MALQDQEMLEKLSSIAFDSIHDHQRKGALIVLEQVIEKMNDKKSYKRGRKNKDDFDDETLVNHDSSDSEDS